MPDLKLKILNVSPLEFKCSILGAELKDCVGDVEQKTTCRLAKILNEFKKSCNMPFLQIGVKVSLKAPEPYAKLWLVLPNPNFTNFTTAYREHHD